MAGRSARVGERRPASVVRLLRAVVRGFDLVSHRATVQPLGSGATYMSDVPVSREVGELLAGDRVLVALLDEHNAGDAVLLCRYGRENG